MSTQVTVFDELNQVLNQGGVEPFLAALERHLRSAGQYHELFETLKMAVRHRAGLAPTLGETPDDLSDAQRSTLEEGLLAACREVGQLFLKDGKIRDGWLYLRPTGDMRLARQVIEAIVPDESNREELIEVLLHEGVDPARGFRLVLEHFGTCASITTLETVLAQRPKCDREVAAGLLVEQLHRELIESLRSDIRRKEGSEPKEVTIRELVADRDWMFGDFAYHIDTTHLASTMRFARLIDDRRQLGLALDLTAYGLRLSSQFQYRGDEPFADIYPAHRLLFLALLGEEIDDAVEYFGAKAREVDIEKYGMAAREAYVDLLSRLGRHGDALRAALEFLVEPGSSRLPAHLLSLSQRAGDYGGLLDACRARDNVLAYATALLESRAETPHSQGDTTS